MRSLIAASGVLVAAGMILVGTAAAAQTSSCQGDITVRHQREAGLYAPFLGSPAQAFTRLGRLDVGSGDMTETIPYFGEAYELPALIASAAFHPDGTLYTIVTILQLAEDAPAPTSQLATIDMDTGAVRLLGAPYPVTMLGLEIDACGQVYATGFDQPGFLGDTHLYTLDAATGAVTDVGPTGVDEIMDLAIDSAGNLYATTDNVLYGLDPATGQVLSETPIDGVPTQRVMGERCGDDAECDTQSMIMSIAFDQNDELYAMSMVGNHWALLELDGQPQGAPLMRIDAAGGANIVAWTGQPNFHGGDIPFGASQSTRVEALGWGSIKRALNNR